MGGTRGLGKYRLTRCACASAELLTSGVLNVRLGAPNSFALLLLAPHSQNQGEVGCGEVAWARQKVALVVLVRFFAGHCSHSRQDVPVRAIFASYGHRYNPEHLH